MRDPLILVELPVGGFQRAELRARNPGACGALWRLRVKNNRC